MDLQAMKIERQALINAVSTLEMQIESLRQRSIALDLEIARQEAPAPVMYAAPMGRREAKVRSACRYCGTKTNRTVIGSGLEVAECPRCAEAAQSPFAASVARALGV